MDLVSREAPECLIEELSGFPRLQLGAATKQKSRTDGSARTARAGRTSAKLADVATTVLRQRTLENPGNPSHQTPHTVQQAKPDLQQATSTPATLAQKDEKVMRAESTTVPVELAADSAEHAAEPPEYTPAEADYAFDEVDDDILAEAVSHNESLHVYIDAKVDEVSTERSYSQSLRTSITRAFQERGDGTFLWVDLAIEELKKLQSKDTEDILNHLPVGLDEMYCQTLHQVPPHLAYLVAAIFRWVVAARRPLYLHELSTALNLADYSPYDPIGLLKQGIRACGNMIAVSEDDTVKTVHNSVKDFLIGQSSQLSTDLGLCRFQVRIEEADREIANVCITYLEQGCLKDGPVSYQENENHYKERVAQFPFLPYAALYWPDHSRAAAQPILNLSLSFFTPESVIRKNWWHSYWVATTGKVKFLAPRNFNLLHLAAYLDLRPLAEKLLHQGELRSRLDKRDSHGSSALAYTIEMGHMSMFLFLLNLGAKQYDMGETILQLACRKGQKTSLSTS